MSTHLVVVTHQGKDGALTHATRALAREGVNLHGFSMDDNAICFLTSDAQQAKRVLARAGFDARSEEVAAVQLTDRPGELARLCEALEEVGVNIVAGFGMGNGPRARIYVRVDDLRRAAPVLDTHNEGPVTIHAGLGRI